MDEVFAYIGGAVMLLLAALAPKKSRDAVKSVVTGGGGFHLNTNGTGIGSEYATGFASINPQQSVDVAKLPSNRRLTEDEVRALANHVINTYGFKTTPKDLVATAYIESAFDPAAYRNERRKDGTIWDTSYGLMQTLVGTAKDLYSKGYTAVGAPNHTSLKNPLVSMYFGAAYIDWLRTNWPNKSEEWYVRAYNGGPGWERTANGPKNTAIYHGKFVQAYKMFSIDVTFG